MGKLTFENHKTTRTVLHFDDAISITGFGRFNLLVLLATGGCLMCVIIETMSMMFVIPAAECDLQLTLTTKGYLSAASFLGVVSGSHFWGFLADTRGRKKTILISMVTSFFITLISSIVPTDWLFIVLRYCNGLCIGGSSGIVYAYAGEFHNNIYRPKVVSWMGIFVGLGNIALPGLAWLILPIQWTFKIPILDIIFRPWRLLVIAYGLPSIIFVVFVICLPESPKYLLAKKKTDEVYEILKVMYATNSRKPKEEFPVSSITWDENDAMEFKNISFMKCMWKQTAPLIKKPLLLKTFIVCMLQFGAFTVTSGLQMWYPEIFNKMTMFEKQNPEHELNACTAVHYYSQNLSSYDPSTLEPHCNDTIEEEVFTIGIIIGTFLVVLYAIIGILINTIGKKNLLVTFFIISSTAGLTAQYIYGTGVVKLLMGLTLISSANIGVITAVVVDLYPTQVRAMALAVSMMFGRIGAVAGSHLTGVIFYQLCDYTFHVFTAYNLVLIILVVMLPTSPRIPKMIEIIT